MPDAVTDTEQRRGLGAWRRLGTVRRVRMAALERGSHGHLVLLTLPLAGDLYGLEDHRAARRQVVELVSGWPAWFKIERGVSGNLHAHVVTVSEAIPQQRQDVHAAPIWKLRPLLAYLSKPAEGKSARSAHRRGVPLLDLWQAAETYLSARAAAAADGRSRLPACSGVVNLPPCRRAVVSPLLIVAVFGLQMAERQARARHYMAVVTLRRSQRRGTALAGVSQCRRARCRLPGDSVRFRSRRPALVGHARSPPRKRPRRLVIDSQRRGLLPFKHVQDLHSDDKSHSESQPTIHAAMSRPPKRKCSTA